MPPEPKKTLARFMRHVLTALGVVFVAYAAFKLVAAWDGEKVTVSLPWALASLVPASLSMLLQLAGWRALVGAISGVRLPWRAAGVLYVDSQLARYMPGKVGLVAVRVAGAKAVGVSERVMVSSLLVETASWGASGVAVGLLGAVLLAPSRLLGHLERASADAALPPWFANVLLALGSLGLLGLLLLCILPRRVFPPRLLVLLGHDEATRSAFEPLVPVLLPVCHLGHWGSWVLVGACLGRALGHSGLEVAWLGAILCVAIVAGFLAFLAPAGAGVREAVVGVAAVPVLGAAGALAFGVLARGTSLVSEVLVWAAFRFAKRDSVDGRTKPQPGAPT